MSITYERARELLATHDQEQVLAFWSKLSDAGREGLLGQIDTIDFDLVDTMRELLIREEKDVATRHTIEPAPVVSTGDKDEAALQAEGERVLSDGEAAVLLVAGGQGSRLGFDGPKGAFPLAPLTETTLFGIHARKVLAMEKRYACQLPFYIMTSRMNDAATRRFFKEHDVFGLAPERVKFFSQGMWPALGAEGKIILDRPDHIFMSPDGHGGVIRALKVSGMLEDMKARGVERVFYFQVDNPLVAVADPMFLGLHAAEGADVSLKVCPKRDPEEGLGVVAKRDGQNAIVEYTELSKEQKHARLPDGRLKFLYGNVAIHIFSLDFLDAESTRDLPLHQAHKKVPVCNDKGETIQPDRPNAYKFERFIFDILPDAGVAVSVAFRREEEFSPVKNASGPDSPDTARRDMNRKFAGWLASCGVDVPQSAGGEPLVRIEIDPCYALDAAELCRQLPRGFTIDGDVLLQAGDRLPA